jgi:aspartate/tyrosine/aromatic aminotransferase
VRWNINREQAERIVYEAKLDHEYLPLQGNEKFVRLACEVALGPAGSKGNVASIQTISGTGSNHIGALFLAQHLKPKHVWISDPTWGNHDLIWKTAAPGASRKTYPYYRDSDCSLDFEGMLSTLDNAAVENDIVLLHACAHNPTGIDPTLEQWKQILDVCKRKRLFPFFDSAYQGFASGDVGRDGAAVRLFQESLFDGVTPPAGMCVAQSFAKSFGLYGERVGAFHLILPKGTPSAGAYTHLLRLTRAEISTCPLYGARIVETILSSPRLRDMWQNDLLTMSGRIKHVRSSLRRELEALPGSGQWPHLESQIGMFSFTGLTEDQVLFLREKYHIYLMRNGRVSLSGLNQGNVKYVAMAINDAVTQSKSL